MPLLVFRNGVRKGERYWFERGVVLGRGPLADLELKDPAVSRRHALVSWAEERCFVSDLQSGNGTYVNGERVRDPVQLGEGDEVRVGSTCLEFRKSVERGRDLSLVSRILLHDAQPVLSRSTLSKSVVIPMSGKRTTTGRTSLAAELKSLQQRFEFVTEVGRTMAKTLDEAAILGEVLRLVLDILPQADRAFVVLYDEEKSKFVPCVARTRSGAATEIPASRTLLEEVVRKRHALLSTDIGQEGGFAAAVSVRALDLRSVACVPLIAEDRVHGVLQVDNSERTKRFTEADLAVLVGIAGPIAVALVNARLHRELVDRELLEHDLALARRIQQRFLPKSLPDLAGYRFAVEYSPALAVGGDLYDLVPLPDGRLALAVGDVSGKGVSGALMMARLTSELRAAAVRRAGAAAVLEDLNEVVHSEATEGMFVTLLYGILDPSTGRIELANAGHLRPALRHPDGRCGELSIVPGAALGFKRPLRAAAYAVQLGPGDHLALFTDGLTEAADARGERYGSARVVEAARHEAAPEAALAAILRAVRDFIGERPLDDDLTLICLGRDG
jgi:sigma-B regulation protein RsbU (phosphoserine phosphatase)